jgi:Ydr279p protein family (RNase H2 complex component) wHTH domain
MAWVSKIFHKKTDKMSRKRTRQQVALEEKESLSSSDDITETEYADDDLSVSELESQEPLDGENENKNNDDDDKRPRKRKMLIGQLDQNNWIEPMESWQQMRLPQAKVRDRGALYVGTGDGNLFEMQKWLPSLAPSSLGRNQRSWFIDDNVCSEGSFVCQTAVDRLFVLLPMLESNRRKNGEHDGVYCSLDQMLAQDAERFADLKLLWSDEAQRDRCHRDIAAVCDVRETFGKQMYRLNDELVLRWLCIKVLRVEQYIREHSNRVSVVAGAVAKQALAADDDDKQKDVDDDGNNKDDDEQDLQDESAERIARLRAAIGFVGELAEPHWLKRIKEAFNLPAEHKASALDRYAFDRNNSQTFHVRSGGAPSLLGGGGGDDDDDDDERKAADEAAKKKSTLSAAQKRLKKAATGMKSIMSFFGKK